MEMNININVFKTNSAQGNILFSKWFVIIECHRKFNISSMKKSFLTIAVIAICSMMNAQTTLKVKTIKEEASLPQSYISCTIKVDYPVSSSATLNSRIRKFIFGVMDVDKTLGWAAGASKPQIQLKDMTSFRKYMKAYTKNIVNYGKKELGENGDCDIYIEFIGQGTKFVCYKCDCSQVILSSNHITMDYYIVSKATGKLVKSIFKDNAEDKLFALARNHLKNDEERKTLEEEKDRCVPHYWMEDSRFVHFEYVNPAGNYIGAIGKIPVREAKAYMTNEMKALL